MIKKHKKQKIKIKQEAKEQIIKSFKKQKKNKV
jgi:hypothetical protein